MRSNKKSGDIYCGIKNRQKIKNSTVSIGRIKDSIFKVAMHYAKCEDLANEI